MRRTAHGAALSAHPSEVVGPRRQKLADVVQTLNHDLADEADQLGPVESLLDPLSVDI